MPALASVVTRPPGSATRGKTTYTSPRFQPFDTAEEAWLWTMAALTARRDGARFGANKGLVSRPCDPDDVVRCLDVLFRQQKITLAHARILRLWGERQMAPSPLVAAERQAHRVWGEALARWNGPSALREFLPKIVRLGNLSLTSVHIFM